MLKPVQKTVVEVKGSRFVIIASRYNAIYVEGMVKAAEELLTKAGAEEVKIIRVPGAFEIPGVAARLARRKNAYSAVLCLGIIFRGATAHAHHIGEAVSHALARISVDSLVPIIHGVLLLDNEQQAQQRCLEREHNRGAEAALTALEMVKLLQELD